MWFLIKVALVIVMVVLCITHWDVVKDFVSAIADWIVYWIEIISAGPPKISVP